jgi:PAS domain S-box-containing protein
MTLAQRKILALSKRDEAQKTFASHTQELAPSINWSDISPSEHVVQFYETDSFLLDSVSDFIGAGLGSGAACIVLATSAHQQELTQRLQANGLNLASLQARGKYFSLDAAEILAQLLREGSPDPQQFVKVISGLIEHTVPGEKPIRIFGEMVALLWQQGKHTAALHLETLWNELRSRVHPFSLLCAYPLSLFAEQAHEQAFTYVCQQHSQVIPAESYSQLSSSNERLRTVSLFQQKASALEAEMVQHKEAAQQLRFAEKRYRHLFETAAAGILIVDAHNGLITDVNPFMTHLLRTSREEIVNQTLWQVGLLPDQPTQQAFLDQLQQDRQLSHNIVKLVVKGGRSCYVEWMSTLLQANDGYEIIQCNIHDISDRRQAEEDQLHLAAIVCSCDDAILSKDLDGIVTSWNMAAERMYGYSAQEMVGQPITRIFPRDRQDEFRQVMEHIRQGEQVNHFETTRVRKDGTSLPVSITVSPIKERSGVIIGASTIARDITMQKVLEQQREAFVSLVTHELKTPLTALQANVQLAQRRLRRLLIQATSLTEEQQQSLEEVLLMLGRSQQPLRVQQRLINDLLDLSYLQQDRMELRLATFDLIKRVDEVVQDHQAVYPSRLILLELPEQDSLLVHADQDRITQVLGNYLTNALKFAPESVPVRVGITVKAATVRVWVADQGPGLSVEQQVHVWKRFYQITETPLQNGWEAGLGLGLYLCQQLIQRQQGEVGVESSPGQGATFWFALPLQTHLIGQ